MWSAMKREGRRGRSGRKGAERAEGEGGHALGPFKVSGGAMGREEPWGHDKVCGAWDHGAMERHGAGRAEGAERAERAEGEGGHALGPFKSADRVQSREAMGAMGRDGTMEPWGHEPLGRAEAAEKG